MQSDAIRCNQRQSDAIRCNQMQSDAIRCNQMQSDAIRGNQMQSEAIRGNQRQSARTRSLGSENYVGPDHESARIGSEHRRLSRQLRAAVHVQRRDGIGLAVWSAPVGRGWGAVVSTCMQGIGLAVWFAPLGRREASDRGAAVEDIISRVPDDLGAVLLRDGRDGGGPSVVQSVRLGRVGLAAIDEGPPRADTDDRRVDGRDQILDLRRFGEIREGFGEIREGGGWGMGGRGGGGERGTGEKRRGLGYGATGGEPLSMALAF